MLTDNHEKNRAWKRIWILSQTDETGNFIYYPGLTKLERLEFWEDYFDFLDYEPGKDSSETNPDPQADVDQFEGEPRGLYHPSQYSFSEKRDWIPWAENAQSGRKRGSYAKGYPAGLVIHWTAGHRNGLEAGNKLMRNTGMNYLIIDQDGTTAQCDSLKFYGYHAGKSSHIGAEGYVSDEYAGVEVQAAGMLRKHQNYFYPWWDKGRNLASNRIGASEVFYSEKKDNIAAGYYHKFTASQVWSLRRLVAWLYLNNPEVFKLENVVGHDEVSPGRKVDPGAAIVYEGEALTMQAFRDLCQKDIAEILKRYGK